MANPAREFLEHKEKEASERMHADLKLWHAWDQGGRTPELLQPLINRYNPVIGRKEREWRAPSVEPSAFRAELMRNFIDAAHTFDPSKGYAFNTHVQTRLQKAKRYNTRFQNVGYIPEELTRYIGPYQSAHNELTENLGRAPTRQEIADKLQVPVHRIKDLQKSMRKDVSASTFETDPFGAATSREEDVLRLMQARPTEYFTPDEHNVFKHIYALDGAAKITGTNELSSKLGITPTRVSRIKSRIADKIKSNL